MTRQALYSAVNVGYTERDMTAALESSDLAALTADGYRSQIVAVAERWRLHLGLSHCKFMRLVRRSEVEWASMRASRRGPSTTFTRALRRAIHERERGTAWPALLDAAIQADTLQRLA